MTTVRQYLVQFGLWLARHGGWNEAPPLTPESLVSPEIFQRALILTREVETTLIGGGGEAKRHFVYARLLKEFPNKREAALAIELALLHPKEG